MYANDTLKIRLFYIFTRNHDYIIPMYNNPTYYYT